jgi:hypothetical protein
MKRSDMIQNIASELVHEYTNFMSFDKALNMAEIILNRLEIDGMQPPSIPTGASGWEVGKGMPSYINKWEPVDE